MMSTWVTRSSTASTMLSVAASLMPIDVDDHQDRMTHDAADAVVRPRLEDRPEDAQVVGHEEGRDGDGDDVVEHQRPAGVEAPELVEGAAGEARRAARLGNIGRRLGVRPGGGAEQQAGEHEDQRRGAERRQRHHAEGVVDRRADVAVGGAETAPARRAPAEADPLAIAPPRHRGPAQARIEADGPVDSSTARRQRRRTAISEQKSRR